MRASSEPAQPIRRDRRAARRRRKARARCRSTALPRSAWPRYCARSRTPRWGVAGGVDAVRRRRVRHAGWQKGVEVNPTLCGARPDAGVNPGVDKGVARLLGYRYGIDAGGIRPGGTKVNPALRGARPDASVIVVAHAGVARLLGARCSIGSGAACSAGIEIHPTLTVPDQMPASSWPPIAAQPACCVPDVA